MREDAIEAALEPIRERLRAEATRETGRTDRIEVDWRGDKKLVFEMRIEPLPPELRGKSYKLRPSEEPPATIEPPIRATSESPSDATWEALKRASNLLSVFAGIDRNMQMITALCLLNVMAMIHKQGGSTVRDVERGLSMSSGSASRNVSYWGEGNKDSKVSGHGFLDWEIDPQDRRRRVLNLTPEGKKFMKAITAIVHGEWWNQSQLD